MFFNRVGRGLMRGIQAPNLNIDECRLHSSAKFQKTSQFFRALFLFVLITGLTLIAPFEKSSAASGTINATVQIKKPLTIKCETDLDFGKLCPGYTDGRVVVTTGFRRYATGGTDIKGYKYHPALFGITGQAGCYYDIQVSAGLAVREQNIDVDCNCNPGGGHHVNPRCDRHNKYECNRCQPNKCKRCGRPKCQRHGRYDCDYCCNSYQNSSGNQIPTLQVVDLVSHSSTVGGNSSVGRINHWGFDVVVVGGTLLVPKTAFPGSYHCDVELTINY